jgi:hypothetical protein
MQRVPGLKKDQAGVVQKVDPRLGDFGMADGNLHALSNPLRKPSLSVFRGHVGSEHGYSKPFPRKNEPPRDVALPGMDGVYMATPAAQLGFRLHDLNQSSFFGIHEALIQVLGLCD